jgi:hypothetical protein
MVADSTRARQTGGLTAITRRNTPLLFSGLTPKVISFDRDFDRIPGVTRIEP